MFSLKKDKSMFLAQWWHYSSWRKQQCSWMFRLLASLSTDCQRQGLADCPRVQTAPLLDELDGALRAPEHLGAPGRGRRKLVLVGVAIVGRAWRAAGRGLRRAICGAVDLARLLGHGGQQLLGALVGRAEGSGPFFQTNFILKVSTFSIRPNVNMNHCITQKWRSLRSNKIE